MSAPIIASCIISGMSEEDYHRDPVEGGSLSSTGAKAILRSPAHYKWQQENRTVKTSFDLGHAVHSMVLGVGLDIVAIPDEILASNGAASTKEAKAFIAQAREMGQVPLKADVVAEAAAMTTSVLSHKVALELFEQDCEIEQSLFAKDPLTGIILRGRIDLLPDVSDKPTTIVDLKTSVSADPRDFARSAAEYGYDIQSELYKELVKLTRGDKDTSFQFIVVEKSAPYLVSVIELDAEFALIGRARVRRAIDIFKACRDSNEWPGYPSEVNLVGPPTWLAYQEGMVI